MERICQKCNMPVSQDAFLCPHCGAILETVAEQNREPKAQKAKTGNTPRILSVALALALIAAVALFLAAVWKLASPDEPRPTGFTTLSPTTEEPAPLVAYEVQLRIDIRKNLQGIFVHICKDGDILYSCEVASNGKATFILPKSDDYTIRLSQLPMPYEAKYRDQDFPFETGQQSMHILLTCENVPYTVKVVDRQGNPLADVSILFKGTNHSETKITDEIGIVVFAHNYEASGRPLVTIISFPTGYYSLIWEQNFVSGQIEMTIVLERYDEIAFTGDTALYQLRVRDEFGQPVAGMLVEGYRSFGTPITGYTNCDGVFVFHGDKNVGYRVRFPENLDYSHMYFYYEEGQFEQEITLKLHNDTGIYTYRLCIVDQFHRPVPGVVLAYQHVDGSYSYFTSDHEGNIQMELAEEDPTKITLQIHQLPEGFASYKETYSFSEESRFRHINLTYVQITQVKIRVVDQYGEPVGNVGLTLSDQDWFYPTADQYFYTGSDGTLLVELDPMKQYEIRIHDYPAGYLQDTSVQYIDATDAEVVFVVYRQA